MNIVSLLPFIAIIGVMFLMTRSAKNKQRQAMQMREQMQPGTGIRTIGGMYAVVKEVHDDTVVLEVAPGVQAVYAKNAVGAVLEEDEYHRIVQGGVADPKSDAPLSSSDEPVVPDDASSLTSGGAPGTARVDLGKSEGAGPEDAARGAAGEDRRPEAERGEDAEKGRGADGK